ncbi:MAG: zinc-dependent alcohol dehydrogenase family protein [Candidatus Bathyarchaeota archaeon]|nr:zinc-dependent alcohol dehydrogenase family protein [Candidatus Bathyarchaeota archaeon]
MKAQVLRRIANVEEGPLELMELLIPRLKGREILVKVSVCGICHTELDEIEGRVMPKLPVILGHQVVGKVVERGSAAERYDIGDRVGVAWIYSACGECYYCRTGNENLCDKFMGTGCHADGGYAEYMVVSEDFAYPIPDRFTDSQAAPLLCAGAIGYRALKLTGMRDGEVLGLYGYGASAHIVHQVVKYKFPKSRVYVFTRRKGDAPSELAKKFGADWVGVTGETPPEKLNRVIDTTPSSSVIKEALKNLDKGGRLVVNVIRKETLIPELEYAEHLWHEKEIKSVANITRKDVQEFLPLAAEISITPEITEFKFEEANQALISLRQGKYRGAGVLRIQK